MSSRINSIVSEFYTQYKNNTPTTIQSLDMFAAFAVAQGVILFLYMLIAGTFPFNSFLAAFIGCVAFFVLLMCLRLQVLESEQFGGVSREKAYSDYVVCNIVLFFVITTFIG